jgi:hypothetical protein
MIIFLQVCLRKPGHGIVIRKRRVCQIQTLSGPNTSIYRPRLPAFFSLQTKRGGLNKYVHGLACQVYEDLE